MNMHQSFQPGSLIELRGREWVVLPESQEEILKLRPLGGAEDDSITVYVPLEIEPPKQAIFPLPNPQKPGSQFAGLLMRDSLRLKLRTGAGPFRCLGNLGVEPRAYQLVPLLMALKQDIIRLLIADDVGIGKTIEAGLIARELLDRGEIQRLTVICPPHLCEQWYRELQSKFNLQAEVVRPGTASRLERGLQAGESIFEAYPFTIVSLDFIKSDRRRDEFINKCPEMVIVEEAHTCVHGSLSSRHQRYRLLCDLTKDTNRHMLFLTATPHSGNEEAFYNLLSLLKPEFRNLKEELDADDRSSLREDLALHFVQRRRPDIEEWQDSTKFPKRVPAETTYTLTGEWGNLFEDVLKYARGMVEQSENKSRLIQRMSWWAALALLRCVSSSPAAATLALRTRLRGLKDLSEEEQIEKLEHEAAETVLDGETDDLLNLDETVPAGTIEEDSIILQELIKKSDKLKGPKNDPKLAELVKQVKKLLQDGFRPVIFCRYIATAHYLAEELQTALRGQKANVFAITGELTPDERENKIESLAEESCEDSSPVLIATDCLSEGINLQNQFNAVIHYDLSWNPTRHEQREGRVDRFGQPDAEVRTLILYGKNNPVDGAVLEVILKKAKKIREELGVFIPVPVESNQLMEAIMQKVLFHSTIRAQDSGQMMLDLGNLSQDMDREWEQAKEKAEKTNKRTQTIFAQRTLKPQQVLPYWERALQVLGDEDDVKRFVETAAERLGATLEPLPVKQCFKLPLDHLSPALKDRLNAAGCEKLKKITFHHPAPAGVHYIHRTHPLVSIMADYVAERALVGDEPDLAARCSAVITSAVTVRTTIFLLRIRCQLITELWQGGRYVPHKTMLAEESVCIGFKGFGGSEFLEEPQALALLNTEASRSMEPAERAFELEETFATLDQFQEKFELIAKERAEAILADHQKVREASQTTGIKYNVIPCQPDIIGMYVLIP